MPSSDFTPEEELIRRLITKSQGTNFLSKFQAVLEKEFPCGTLLLSRDTDTLQYVPCAEVVGYDSMPYPYRRLTNQPPYRVWTLLIRRLDRLESWCGVAHINSNLKYSRINPTHPIIPIVGVDWVCIPPPVQTEMPIDGIVSYVNRLYDTCP